jgi:uncharacterized protein YkwD
MRQFVVLCVVAAGMVAPQAPAEEPKAPPKLELSEQEKTLLELTNKARVAEKLPPLKPNAALFQAARSHSANMAKQDKLEHELDGKRVSDRASAAGYDWDEIAENIAYTDEGSAEEIVNGWLKSEGHRKNLLNPDVTDIGLGVAKNAKGEWYYTQVFGKPHKK